jgi:hypothetical protein
MIDAGSLLSLSCAFDLAWTGSVFKAQAEFACSGVWLDVVGGMIT